jgi:hypothetical protein
MDASGRLGRDDQVPGSFQDSRRPQRLPELDIELPVRCAAANQTLHDETFSHRINYRASDWFLRSIQNFTTNVKDDLSRVGRLARRERSS